MPERSPAMPHHFTDDENSKLDECLARMDDFEKRSCDLLRELEEVEAEIIGMGHMERSTTHGIEF